MQSQSIVYARRQGQCLEYLGYTGWTICIWTILWGCLEVTGWLKMKNLNSSKKFMQIPLKVNKVYFFDIKHGLTMTFWKKKLLTFRGICMNFLLELKFFILSHPVTSKQPHKIVQIHMGHPVLNNKVIRTESLWWHLLGCKISKPLHLPNPEVAEITGKYNDFHWVFCQP